MENYRLLEGDTPGILERKVNDLMSGGWVPHGSPVVHEFDTNRGETTSCYSTVRIRFYQAMTYNSENFDESI